MPGFAIDRGVCKQGSGFGGRRPDDQWKRFMPGLFYGIVYI
jgi:hypothetical protein